MSQLESNVAAEGIARDTSHPIVERLRATRRLSIELARPLTPEDMTVQVMDDASPTKWHLAHATWFFETFVLQPFDSGYRVFDPQLAYCFNSYYESAGPRHPRPQRGILTRPSSGRVLAYRTHVDAALERLLERTAADEQGEIERLLELGINHEQQHQELMLTDILALFAANPLRPAYCEKAPLPSSGAAEPMQWITHSGGIRQIGCDGDGFAWDNEAPRHNVLLQPFRIADRLVSNGEWLEFVADGGYREPLLWLSDGWASVCKEGWQAPLYWERGDDCWLEMTLHGLRPVELAAPVVHVSYFEADAFARWAGKRLPTEAEWEVAAAAAGSEGNTLGAGALRPLPAIAGRRGELRQMLGDAWQWTASAYLPYPGYRAPAGGLGEYNAKFMCGQHVLRGASCVTPDGHSRTSYRNFFYPHQRWQFSGVRLAAEAS